MKKIGALFLLALSAALLGGLVGAISAGFLHFIEWGQEFLWGKLTSGLPGQALILCVLGGVLVGLCQRYLGDHPKSIYEAVEAIQKTGRLEYNQLHKGLVTASTSLIFGASLGPEAAIVDLLGGLGTWVGDSIRALREKFALSRRSQPANRIMKILQSWPNLIALAIGAVVFVKLLNGLYGGGFLNPHQAFRWEDLLWSIPMGMLGAAAGGLFLALQAWTRKLAAPLRHKPILRSTLGGIILGLIALFLPLVLFSGQHDLQPAYDQALQLGFWALMLTALARLLLTNLLLATGWKGGQFLPIIFAGTALGLSIQVLFPSIPAPVAAIATIAALVAVVLPRPLIGLALMALMFPIQYVGVSVVAVGVVVLAKGLWKRRASRAALPASGLEKPAS